MPLNSSDIRVKSVARRAGAAIVLFTLICLVSGCQSGSHVASSTKSFPAKTGFVERHIVVDGFVRPVWVFLPPDYNPNRMYPAILFLHGIFEQGNGGTNVLSAGLGPVIAGNPKRWPFITIFPQSSGSWKGDDRERLALAALKDAQREYAIDPDRVILAGLSLGGQGVWQIGANNAQLFAALVPASAPSAESSVKAVAGIPVWAFASHDDPFVAAENSEGMCKAIESNGGRAKLTEFEGNEHDCWSLAIEQSQLLPWMLAQARNPLQTATNTGGESVAIQASGRLRAWSSR